jgi:hypothetical protein
MTIKHTLLSLSGASALGLMLACGGGGGGSTTPTPTSTPATSLSYTDPTSGTWQLKKNVASTSQHLILDLVAVSAGTGAGVALEIAVDGNHAQWSQPIGGDTQYLHNGTVLNLGTGTLAFKGKVVGSTLHIALSQKGLASPATFNGTVAQIALDLKPGSTTGAVGLTVVTGKAKVLPASGTIADLPLSIGSLTAN